MNTSKIVPVIQDDKKILKSLFSQCNDSWDSMPDVKRQLKNHGFRLVENAGAKNTPSPATTITLIIDNKPRTLRIERSPSILELMSETINKMVIHIENTISGKK